MLYHGILCFDSPYSGLFSSTPKPPHSDSSRRTLCPSYSYRQLVSLRDSLPSFFSKFIQLDLVDHIEATALLFEDQR